MTRTRTTPETDQSTAVDEQITAPVPGWNPPPPPRPRPQDPQDPREEIQPPSDGDEAAGDGDSGPSHEGESSRASTDPAEVLRAHRGRVVLAGQLIGAALAAAGGVLNVRLGSGEDGDDIWLMQDDDMETIAVPLSRVAARRIPLPDGGGQASDIADLIVAGIGAVGYVARNVREQLSRRRRRPAVVDPGGELVDEPDADSEQRRGGQPTGQPSPVDVIRTNAAGIRPS